MPTNTLWTHCRRDGSMGDVISIPEDLQAAWLQGTQHGDALVLSSVSGVVRSLGKRRAAAPQPASIYLPQRPPAGDVMLKGD